MGCPGVWDHGRGTREVEEGYEEESGLRCDRTEDEQVALISRAQHDGGTAPSMPLPFRLLRRAVSFRAARQSLVSTSRPVLTLPLPRATPFFRADASTSTSSSSPIPPPMTSTENEPSSTTTEEEDSPSHLSSLPEVGHLPSPLSFTPNLDVPHRGKGPKPPGPSRTIPKNRKKPPLPPLIESDLDETFVRGTFPFTSPLSVILMREGRIRTGWSIYQ
jgi:hypothetical protein